MGAGRIVGGVFAFASRLHVVFFGVLSHVGACRPPAGRGRAMRPFAGFALTLIDSLDMLALIGDYPEFRRAIVRVMHQVNFDRNVTVSIFETTIRVMGGLLSAHVLASDPDYGIVPWYKGAQTALPCALLLVADGDVCVDASNWFVFGKQLCDGVRHHLCANYRPHNSVVHSVSWLWLSVESREY